MLAALSGYSVRNSLDDASDGPYTHTFDSLNSISFLMVGAPPRSNIGDIGAIQSINESPQFYITDIGLTAAIPEPTTYSLFLAGLGVVGLVARKRRK